MSYDRDAHRRRSIRLPSWDYAEQGAYFVTICTHGRGCILNDAGIFAVLAKAWARSVCGGEMPPPHEFVVMPNHVHGIVWVTRGSGAGARHGYESNENLDRLLEPKTRASGERRGASPLRSPGCRPGSLGALVGAFKSSAAKRINAIRGTPGAAVWQRNYYERVIRDERALERAREYILDNPRKWAEDRYFPVPAP